MRKCAQLSVRDFSFRNDSFLPNTEQPDPFTGLPGVKTSVLPDAVRMKVVLPEFAKGYCACKSDGSAVVSVAQNGEVTLKPGDYLLTAGSPPGADDLAASAALGVPEFSAPVPPLPEITHDQE